MSDRQMNVTLRLKAEGGAATAAETEKVKASLSGVGTAAQTTGSRADALSASLWKLAAPLAAVAGSLAMLPQLVSVQREFDKINTSLVTVTGSVGAAEAAFDGLSAFASRTPFSLQEVSNAFIKLRALGLEPTERALTSYGNTASAMGKSLNQMIEAVADASTGEMERLKEFGIKAKQEGDRVSFTFRGVTTTIGNSAAEIQRYLMGLGEVEFAGAMERQAATLDGAISNLGDSWSQLMLTISRQGPGDLMHDTVRTVSGSLSDLTAIIREMGRSQDGVAESAGRFAAAQDALRTIFETIAIAGANVSFVFKTLGLEIGAWAAQIAALGRGDLAGFRAISDAVKADAARARAELDDLTRRILNPLKQLSGPGILDARDLRLAQDALGALGEGTDKAGKSAKKAKDEYGALMARINGRDVGLDASYWKDLATLNRQYLKTGDLESYRSAVEKLTRQQKFYTDELRETEAAERLAADAAARRLSEEARAIQALVAMTTQGKLAALAAQQDLAVKAMTGADGSFNFEGYDEIINQLGGIRNAGRDTFDELARAVDGWGKGAAAAFVDFAATGKGSFGDLVASMLREAAKMMVYESLFKPLFGMLGESFKSVMPAFGGGRASGGAVYPGSFYRVNEVAPELLSVGGKDYLMMGGATGHVTPLSSMGGGVSGGGNVHVSVAVDATGSQVAGDGAQAGELGRRIAAAVRMVLIDEKRPGGLLAT